MEELSKSIELLLVKSGFQRSMYNTIIYLRYFFYSSRQVYLLLYSMDHPISNLFDAYNMVFPMIDNHDKVML